MNGYGTAFNDLGPRMAQFDAISLQEMSDAALMKRMDTKFVIRSRDLEMLLEAVKKDYRMLEIDGLRSHSYASLYFDTPDQKFYLDHHNRKLGRSKIRMRKYLDSDLSFFEIKQKDQKGQTSKSRTGIPDLDENLSEQNRRFILKILDEDLQLQPTISNSFERITLVHRRHKERVTIDRDIRFFFKDENRKLEQVSIIEIKQERINRETAVYRQLKWNNFRPMRISKYCIGMASLFPDIKYNRFKQKIIHLDKIS